MNKKKKIFIAVAGAAVLTGALIFVAPTLGDAATNIDSTNRHAHSDAAGWWDFFSTDTVNVGPDELNGYASSSMGYMSLNCATSPNGDECSSSNYKVTNIGGTGNLAGCAYNDTIGWIHFWCGDGDCDGSGTEDASSTCAASDHRVTIDGDGFFQGYAYNDTEGWISFNCANDSSCGNSDFKLQSSWTPGEVIGTLESSVIDTQKQGGVTLHSIVWQGTQPSGTSVDFQVAVSSTSTGPWNWIGPDGTNSTWYGRECPQSGASDPAAGPNTAICIDKTQVQGMRFLKYKVRLQSNLAQDETPTIEDIILNWSE